MSIVGVLSLLVVSSLPSGALGGVVSSPLTAFMRSLAWRSYGWSGLLEVGAVGGAAVFLGGRAFVRSVCSDNPTDRMNHG